MGCRHDHLLRPAKPGNSVRTHPNLSPWATHFQADAPPQALVPYYTDARNRGYLADPAGFPEASLELAKRYTCILPDITKDELFKMLGAQKDPWQIFFGLAPGWAVNMADKKILKPTHEKLLEYCGS